MDPGGTREHGLIRMAVCAPSSNLTVHSLSPPGQRGSHAEVLRQALQQCLDVEQWYAHHPICPCQTGRSRRIGSVHGASVVGFPNSRGLPPVNARNYGAGVDKHLRTLFNHAFTPALHERYTRCLSEEVGPIRFRLAETPLFLPTSLRAQLLGAAKALVNQLSQPALHARLVQAIPPRFRVPNMDTLPHCVQVDFALCQDRDGQLVGRVIELQGFPSLFALMDSKARAWAEQLNTLPGMPRSWQWFVEPGRDVQVERLRRMIVADEDPQHVCLVDLTPEQQKTSPDFVATQRLLGIDYVCVTKLIKRGNRLFRIKDGREVPVRRIYNRLVFDELVAKKVEPPFQWNEELDVSWCSHPNWYWAWSKYALPLLNHPAVPRAHYLSDLHSLPDDLHRYVLKPLFSFAGRGVKVDVTKDDITAIPTAERTGWILQEKVDYALGMETPQGMGVKAEVRVMLSRGQDEQALSPCLFLVRLSRGKMIGMDHNRNLEWEGGTVGMWS